MFAPNPAPPTTATTRIVAPPVLLSVGSVILAALGLRWAADPQSNPIHRSDSDMSLVGLLPAAVSAWLFVTLGVLGLGAALLLARGVRSTATSRAVRAVAVLELVVLGFGVPDLALMAILGYLTAMAVPALVVALLIVLCRHSVRWRLAAATLAVGVLWWGTTTGAAEPASISRLARELAGGFGSLGVRPFLLVGSSALGLLWGVALLSLVAPRGAPRSADERVDRWTRRAAVVAAGAPLPYVLVRSTWLTPWPVVGVGPSMDLTPEIRLWGLLLGCAALGGATLTLGLIRPWGTTFPRWVPGLAGRSVPVRLAAVPGALVAYLVTVGAPAIVIFGLTGPADGHSDRLLLPVLMPFWLWGPALGVATWGYVRRRTPGRPRHGCP